MRERLFAISSSAMWTRLRPTMLTLVPLRKRQQTFRRHLTRAPYRRDHAGAIVCDILFSDVDAVEADNADFSSAAKKAADLPPAPDARAVPPRSCGCDRWRYPLQRCGRG